MSQEKIRLPKEGGLDEARRRLKELRRKEPSSDLVKIIEEVTRDKPVEHPDKTSDDDIAAKPRRELDL